MKTPPKLARSNWAELGAPSPCTKIVTQFNLKLNFNLELPHLRVVRSSHIYFSTYNWKIILMYTEQDPPPLSFFHHLILSSCSFPDSCKKPIGTFSLKTVFKQSWSNYYLINSATFSSSYFSMFVLFSVRSLYKVKYFMYLTQSFLNPYSCIHSFVSYLFSIYSSWNGKHNKVIWQRYKKWANIKNKMIYWFL